MICDQKTKEEILRLWFVPLNDKSDMFLQFIRHSQRLEHIKEGCHVLTCPESHSLNERHTLVHLSHHIERRIRLQHLNYLSRCDRYQLEMEHLALLAEELNRLVFVTTQSDIDETTTFDDETKFVTISETLD